MTIMENIKITVSDNNNLICEHRLQKALFNASYVIKKSDKIYL